MHLDELASLIDAEVSADNLTANIEAIQALDRQFTFPKFTESARLVTDRLAEYGLDSRVLEQPADGTSRMGDWTMPLAWDCREAVLEVLAPEEARGRVLCRRSEDPNAVAMWSAPTPPEGVTGEVVGPLVGRVNRSLRKLELCLGAGENAPLARAQDVAGKVVYTPSNPRGLKPFLVESGAAGVITSFSPAREYLPHNRFWINGWADDPGGWAYTAKDTPMWCFVLTPAQGVEFEQLLARGPVSVRAAVESRLYEGILPAATGLLAGESTEEILTLGHQFEIGADDSASGCAVMLEAARVLRKLTADGRLPAPARSLRWLFMSECYGSIAYVTMNPHLARRTLAAMNLDCVGGDQRRTEMAMPVSLTPGANPSVADTLIRRLCEGYLRRRDPYFAWFATDFTPCDSSIGDPAIGIPAVYLGGKDRFWHTTADTVDKIDPGTVARVTVLAASYAYYLAAAGSPEAEWLAEETAAEGRRDLAAASAELAAELRAAAPGERGRVLGLAGERLAYLRDVAAERVRSSQKFASRTERREFRAALRPMVAGLKKQARLEEDYLGKLAARLAFDDDRPAPVPEEPERPEWWEEACSLVPVRTVAGTITLDEIPRDQRDGCGSPRWNGLETNVLFRCDGRRTLAEAWRLGRLDTESHPGANGDRDRDFMKLVRLLERHGLIELRRAGRKVVPEER